MAFLCLFPPHSDAPFRVLREMVWGIRFFQCQVEKCVGENKLYTVGTSFICPPTACHARFCVCGAWDQRHPPAPAHLPSFSPQTQAPRCLQTPRLRAQAQSPLCHLHSEEPDSHLSPSLPMEITVPGTALPHCWDPPSLSRRVRHYVRKAPPAPHHPHHAQQRCAVLYPVIIHGLLAKRCF